MSDLHAGAEDAREHSPDAGLVLTDEHRMLLDIRDALYEGQWDDFAQDLRARMNNEPHVFETTPASPGMVKTIREHLALIDQMQAWEAENGERLTGSREV